jgi:hypothetical protein
VRDSSEVIWGIGRVLEKNFYGLPFTPPSLVRCYGPSKGLCLAGPLRSGETSRPDSTDPVASRVKYGPHGGKKSKTKSSIRAGSG